MKKILFVLLLILATSAHAFVKVAEVFTSNMVLQQEKNIRVWGTADAGEQVKVVLGKQKTMTTADADGRWMAELKPMKATAKPQTMTISGKKNKVVLKNLLIGEVWLASGQSNMEYSMNAHPKYVKPKKGDPDYLKHEWEKANNPNIRLLFIEKNVKCDTLPTRGWQMVTQESLTPFSAAAWFFAEMLQDSLQVPVGIITSAWGGTYIEEWMDGESPFGRTPMMKNPDGLRYRKMIRPIAPLSIRGFLWYQGEANLADGDTDIYMKKQQHLVSQWREAFRDESLPFYYVQLSPFIYSTIRELVPKHWLSLPLFWDAQTRCMDVIPNSGMVVTTDIPENLNDIHPPYKWVVGRRLARWALHDVYGYTDLECSGPRLRTAERQDDKLLLTFDHCEGGLTTFDGKEPSWFQVFSKRRMRFDRCQAIIDGNRIIITLGKDQQPYVRFGYDEVAQPNLCNKAGLPAIPFEIKL